MEYKHLERASGHLQVLWLPLVMALLFAAQNIVFNAWLGLFDSGYAARLFWSSFALGLIVYGPALFFGRRLRYAYLLCVSFFIAAVFAGQFLFFEYGQSFLQVSALKYFFQASSVWGTVVSFASVKLLFFAFNIFLAAGTLALAVKKGYRPILLSGKEKTGLFLLLLCIAGFGYYFLVRQENIEWGNSSRLYKDVYDLNVLVKKVGIMNFTLEDTVKYIARSNQVTAQDKQFLADFVKHRPTAPAVKNPQYAGIAKGKNIIFIQIESLENAVIGQSINGQAITPTLNALTSQGVYVTHYYTQVGPGNTADAEFSTLNSLYPLQNDVVFTNYAHDDFHALPQHLVAQGYHTYALHGDVPTFWNRSNIYPALGYQQQISLGDYVMTRSVGHGPSPLGDEDFLTQSVSKMSQFSQPFMATVITESSHTPFELPQDLQTLNMSGQTQLTYTQQQYLQSIHYMDMALGKFIEGLKQSGLYDNSVIFIYGDHQSFTDISKALGREDANFPVLSGSQVPMIILNSGIFNAQLSMPASHMDLYPTIVNLLGLPPLKTVFGQDIFNTRQPVVVRRNIFTGSINSIVTDRLAFRADSDGLFLHGTCLAMPTETPLPVAACQDLYTQQVAAVKASDIIIRGNLLSALK